MRPLHGGSALTRSATAVFATALLLSGCHPAPPPRAAAAAPAPPISMAALRGAAYRLAFDPTRTVRLVNGVYDDAGDVDAAMKVTTRMLDSVTTGTLPDDRAEAAVILVTNAGGSGNFYDLALMADSEGTPQNLATVGLGDRVKVKHITLYADSVAVTLVTHGPADPMCCPALEVTRHFVLDRGRLIPTDKVRATGKDSA
ncbi:MAG: hypothetical protein ACHQXA_09835 [Gemmatimonadales bacterium]